MRNRGSILAGLALLAAIGLLDTPIAKATTYRDLCSSVPSACEYTGPDAPVLAAVVCWERSTSTARLMTGASCPTGSWPYFAKYGVVEPLTQTVTAFQPLDDACSRPGLCQPGILAPPTTTGAVMCCFGDTCYPAGGDECYGGELFYCSFGASNDDGTITCFDEEGCA